MNCLVLNAFHLCTLFAFKTFFYSTVTDESFLDEMRVWRKYKILILVSMMSLFDWKILQLVVTIYHI